jgi:AcrR family transcriptional regulator
MNPKSQKAKNKIIDAFIQLLHVKAFETITIKEIMEIAGCSRSVFYAHFKTKEEIFTYIEKNIFYKFIIHHQSDENYFTSDQVIWDYINLYDKYGLVFIMLQRHNVDTFLTKKMLLDVKKSMEVSFEKDELLKKHINYFLPFLISSIVSVTTNWVRAGKKESKEELFHIIKYFRSVI